MKNFNHIRTVLLTAVLLLTAVVSYAQNTATDSVQFCKVSLTNGNVVTGVLIGQDSANVTLNNSALGTLTILKSNVETIQTVETGSNYSFTMSTGKVYRGSVVRQDADNIVILIGSSRMGLMTANITDFSPEAAPPAAVKEKRVDHGSRYLIAPSAIPLKKGDGYYHNACFFVNGWHYGVTDRWSVGGGVIFPVGMYGQFKYGQPLGEKLHVAAGGMFVTSFFDMNLGLACGFGSVTWGDRYTNATFSIGYGAAGGNGNWQATRRPILNLSGMARLSDNVSLITENYLFPIRETRYLGNGEYHSTSSYYPQLSGGFRIGGGRHSFDIAAMTIGDITEGDVFAVPYIGYAYRFSDK